MKSKFIIFFFHFPSLHSARLFCIILAGLVQSLVGLFCQCNWILSQPPGVLVS